MCPSYPERDGVRCGVSVRERTDEHSVPPPITAVGGVSWLPGGTGIVFAGKTEDTKASYDIYRMRLSAEEPAIRLIVTDGI